MARQASKHNLSSDSTAPILRYDDYQSYRNPFLLRVHPDQWLWENGAWEIALDRLPLVEGVGGVSYHKPTKTFDTSTLTVAWAGMEDRKWVLLANGTTLLTGTPNLFMEEEEVRVFKEGRIVREGAIAYMAPWESIKDKCIVQDAKVKAEFAKLVAKALFNLDGPTDAAKKRNARAMQALMDHIISHAQKNPRKGSDAHRRLIKVAATLDSWMGGTAHSDRVTELYTSDTESLAKALTGGAVASTPSGADSEIEKLRAQLAEMQKKLAEASAPKPAIPVAPLPVIPTAPPPLTNALPLPTALR